MRAVPRRRRRAVPAGRRRPARPRRCGRRTKARPRARRRTGRARGRPRPRSGAAAAPVSARRRARGWRRAPARRCASGPRERSRAAGARAPWPRAPGTDRRDRRRRRVGWTRPPQREAGHPGGRRQPADADRGPPPRRGPAERARADQQPRRLHPVAMERRREIVRLERVAVRGRQLARDVRVHERALGRRDVVHPRRVREVGALERRRCVVGQTSEQVRRASSSVARVIVLPARDASHDFVSASPSRRRRMQRSSRSRSRCARLRSAVSETPSAAARRLRPSIFCRPSAA